MTCIFGTRIDGSTACMVHGDRCSSAPPPPPPKENRNRQLSLDAW